MTKYLKYILISIIIMLGNIENVGALGLDGFDTLDKAEQSVISSGNIPNNSEGMITSCSYVVKKENKYYGVIVGLDVGSGKVRFYATDTTFFEFDQTNSNITKKSILDKMYYEFYCPSYIGIDHNYINEICAGDKKSDCPNGDRRDYKDSTVVKSEIIPIQRIYKNLTSEGIYENLSTINSSLKKTDVAEICVYNRKNTGLAGVTEGVNNIVDQAVIINANNKFIIYNYTQKKNESYGQWIKASEGEKGFQNIVCSGINNVYMNVENSNRVFSDSKNAKKNDYVYLKYSTHLYKSDLMVGDPIDPNNCEELLGEEMVNEINSILIYVKVAVPIIVIIMGSIDFGKALLSSSEDEMKKAQTRFFKRLLIGMVIFFIPTFINVLLNVANQVWIQISPETCGIGL